MSIITGIKDFIGTCPHLSEGIIHVDFIAAEEINYSIDPLPGTKIIKEYLDGSSLREYHFALHSRECTADDLSRIENSGFIEDFSEWLEKQSKSENFPLLPIGKTTKKIEAGDGGCLFERDEADTGVYQIICKLTYLQEDF